MRYCVATNAVHKPNAPVPLSGDFSGNMRRACEMGYHAIEIHVPDVAMIDVATVRAAMRETGMEVSTLGTGTIFSQYGLHLCMDDEAAASRLRDMVFAFIDCAAALDSRVTIGSIKGRIEHGEDRAKCMDVFGRAMRRLDRYAAKRGVTLLLEATNRYENNVLNTAADIVNLVDEYGLTATRALLDVFHMNIEEASIRGALVQAKDVLGHVHIADNNRLYPGAGCFDFEALRAALCQIGYDGVLSVECLPWPTGETAARKAAAFLHAMFDWGERT